MKNGHGNWDDPKVASLEAARKAAEKKKRVERRAAWNIKDRLVGYLLIALALGAVVYWGRKLIGSFALAP